jgi:hypothetical protein
LVGAASAGAEGSAGVRKVKGSDQAPEPAWARHQYCVPRARFCQAGIVYVGAFVVALIAKDVNPAFGDTWTRYVAAPSTAPHEYTGFSVSIVGGAPDAPGEVRTGPGFGATEKRQVAEAGPAPALLLALTRQ